jgi:hypothetical protein
VRFFLSFFHVPLAFMPALQKLASVGFCSAVARQRFQPSQPHVARPGEQKSPRHRNPSSASQK